jgi:hypothetical protein
MPSAPSGSGPRWPTTAVSISTKDGSAASTTKADAESRSIRPVLSLVCPEPGSSTRPVLIPA